jgi:hypothetical protein
VPEAGPTSRIAKPDRTASAIPSGPLAEHGEQHHEHAVAHRERHGHRGVEGGLHVEMRGHPAPGLEGALGTAGAASAVCVL